VETRLGTLPVVSNNPDGGHMLDHRQQHSSQWWFAGNI
jgi:hypothetical protein